MSQFGEAGRKIRAFLVIIHRLFGVVFRELYCITCLVCIMLAVELLSDVTCEY